jgi:hypothetical protein
MLGGRDVGMVVVDAQRDRIGSHQPASDRERAPSLEHLPDTLVLATVRQGEQAAAGELVDSDVDPLGVLHERDEAGHRLVHPRASLGAQLFSISS